MQDILSQTSESPDQSQDIRPHLGCPSQDTVKSPISHAQAGTKYVLAGTSQNLRRQMIMAYLGRRTRPISDVRPGQAQDIMPYSGYCTSL